MKHLIVFGYFLSIFIGGGALTMQVLTGIGKDEDVVKKQPFFLMLLIMNWYDLIIYYQQEIIKIQPDVLLVSLGEFLFAILVCFWIRLQSTLCSESYWNKVVKFTKIYFCVYALIWTSAIAFVPDNFWIRHTVDLSFMLIFIIGTLISVIQGYMDDGRTRIAAYKLVVAFCMLLTYIAYFFGDAGITPPSKDISMEYTIFYWLIISCVNCVFLYKKMYRPVYVDEGMPEKSLEEILAEIRDNYQLTKREQDIIAEIYKGKSNSEIASDLYISESTVKAHAYNAYKKMGVRSRVEAVCVIRQESGLK